MAAGKARFAWALRAMTQAAAQRWREPLVVHEIVDSFKWAKTLCTVWLREHDHAVAGKMFDALAALGWHNRSAAPADADCVAADVLRQGLYPASVAMLQSLPPAVVAASGRLRNAHGFAPLHLCAASGDAESAALLVHQHQHDPSLPSHPDGLVKKKKKKDSKKEK